MPFFKVESDYGFVGTEEVEYIEADNLIDAYELKYENMKENLSVYAVEVTEETYLENN